MIQQRTILKVSDNSGAKTVRCVKVLGGFRKKTAKIGDFVIVSVQQLRNRSKNTSKVKKGEVYKALVIRSRTTLINSTGLRTVLSENSVVLINKQGNPVGTRVVGFITKNLRKKGLHKFISISSGLV